MEATFGELLRMLRAALAGGPALRLALLFGSAARGELRADSDLDLAIEPADGGLPLRAELDLQVALERATGRPVHLVRLDRAPLLLRWRVASEGVVLLAEPPVARVLFLAGTAAEHAELGPGFAEAARRYRTRLLARASSSGGSR
jgi:predicted nucleotidyltransferase